MLGPTTKGRWSYAASKALDEFLALSYWKEKKQPVIVARFFNTVGPRQTGRYGMVLPNFVRQALEDSPITVYGTGQQSRCFCDVRDTIEAVLRLIATDRAVGEVVNIGTDEEISIEGLAHLVKKRTKSSSPMTYIPYDQAYEPGFEDMPRRIPALEKLQRLTASGPTTPLTAIVDRVVEYFQKKPEADYTPRTARAAAAIAGTASAGLRLHSIARALESTDGFARARRFPGSDSLIRFHNLRITSGRDDTRSRMRNRRVRVTRAHRYAGAGAPVSGRTRAETADQHDTFRHRSRLQRTILVEASLARLGARRIGATGIRSR